MKTISHIRYAALLLLVALTGCVRNELPEKRTTSKTRVDHLLIKEVFYAGHYWVRDVRRWGMRNQPQMYNDDQYIEIYNPTDEIKYLDGLALCTNAIDPTTIIQFAPKDDFINRYYGVSAISFFSTLICTKDTRLFSISQRPILNGRCPREVETTKIIPTCPICSPSI